MATLQGQYKAAIKHGLLDQSVTEEQFAGILGDPKQRKAYYDNSNKIKQGAYGTYESFSKAADDILAAYRQPQAPAAEQAVAPQEVPTMPIGAAADSTDAAVAMLMDSNRKQQEQDKKERARINNAQLPISDEDNQREERIRTIDNTLKQVGVDRFANRQPIGDAREEVLQQQQQLEQERTALQGQRKSYMKEPETVEEARESWANAWMENTEEGKQAKREADAAYQQAVDYLRNEFVKSKAHQDIVADVQRKYNSGALTEDEANAELNKRLNDAFIAENKETLEAEYQTLYGGLAQRAYKADNGWLQKQEERIGTKAVQEAIDEGVDELNEAMRADYEAFSKTVGNGFGAAQAKSNYINTQQAGILGAASQLYQETETILESTVKGEEKFGTLTSEILRHSKDKLANLASFGMSDVNYSAYQAGVLKKIADAGAYDNPESVLDRNEQVLYNAIVSNVAAQLLRAENTSHLANAGKLTADMLPFVRDIIMGKGLLGGFSAAAEKGIMRGIVRSIGTGKWGKLLANLGKTGVGLVESTAISLISPSTYQQVFKQEAQIDPTSLHLTDEGWKVDKIDTKHAIDAFAAAHVGMTKELFTETGGMTQFAIRLAQASPLGKYLRKTKIGQIAKMFDNTIAGKLFNQTAYHGFAAELSEEWENTFYDAVFAAINNDNAGKRMEAFGKVYGEFVKPETQVPMLISFALPAIFGGSVSTGQIITINSQYKQAYENLRNTYMKYGATEEEFEDALNELRAARMNMNIEDYPQLIRGLAATLSGGSQEQADEFAAALSAYTVADANLGAIQEKHAKKQRQVQQLIRDIQASEERITSNTHTGSGMMYHVEVGGKPGYFVRGILPLKQYEGDAFGRGIGTEIVTVRMEDGSVKQVAANQIKLLEQPQSAEGAMEFERRRLTARMNNLDRFKVGDVIYMTENGQPIYGNSSRVVDVTDEGVVAEIIDPNGQPNTTVIPHEVAESGLSTSDELVEDGVESIVIKMPSGSLITLQKTSSDDWMQVAPVAYDMSLISQSDLDQMIADGVAEVVTDNRVVPPTEESGSGNGVVSEETVEIGQPAEQPAKPYATDEQGNPAWAELDVEQSVGALLSEMEDDKELSKQFAQSQIAAAKSALNKANKRKPQATTDLAAFRAEAQAIKQEQQAAQAELSKWENILLGIANYKTAEEQAAQAAAVRAQRKQTIEGVGGTNMAERLAASPRIDGNAGSITAADGTKIPGHYVLVSANALTPSHNPNANFAPSEGYPTVDGQSINDRDYQADQEEQAKVQQVAQTYDGRAITNMPVVSDEGLVYSGNGRTMAGQLAAANGTDGAYTEALKENATQFGFTPEQVDEVPNARVVFMTDERLPYNTSTLALFNMTEQQTQSNTAAAAANVRKLTPEAVGHIIAAVQEFDNLDAFFNDSNAPFELVNQLIADGIISNRDKAAFVDNDRLTATGKDRLTALLFGTAFDEKTIRLLGTNAKVRNSVMRALPQILENKGLGDFSLFEHINNAIQAIYDMDTNKMSFFEFTRQIDIEGKTASDKYSAFELLLSKAMVEGGVQSFRDILDTYNTAAKASAGGQMDLFTGEVMTIEQLTKQIVEEYGKEQETSGGAQPQPSVSGVQEGNGEKITDTVASEIIEQITAEAEEFEDIELTPSNWVKLFGEDGIVNTPKGKVKMGEGQFLKLMQKGRDTKLGMIKPTLERPSIIIEDKSKAKEGQKTEREYSYVFVKAFTGKNGERMYYFTSVTVQKDNQEVVVSNQEKERSRIMRLLKEGKLAYINQATLPSDTDTSAQGDQLTNPVGGVSADKGTKNVPNTQEKTAKNVVKQQNSGKNLIQGTDMTADEVVEIVKASVADILEEQGLSEDVEVVSIEVIGSRLRGEAKEDSDLDILLYYKGDIKEDTMFNALNPNDITINGISVDINPIRDQESGDPKKWHQRDDAWREQDRETTERTPREEPVQKSADLGEKASSETKKAQAKTEKVQGPAQKTAQSEQKTVENNGKAQNVGKNTQEDAMRIAKAEADMQEFASKLGAQGVHLISDKEQLPNEEGAAYRAIRNGANVMGWYNPNTNQVYIYLPNANNLQEVYKTLLHEFVAHKGLRDMLGKEKFDQLCHEVWDMMSEQDKLQYALYVKNNTAVGSKAMQELMDGMTEEEKAALLYDTKLQLAAADEYMAHFAETGVSEQDRSIWQRIVDMVRDLLRKAGINLRLTDADIARLLYESSRRLSSDMTMRERSLLIAKNNKVVENITTNAHSMGFSTDTRFRITPEEDQAYLDAVNSGDMATAEQMLRDAAERAGYLPQSDYQDAHGAPRASVYKEDFTNAEAMQEAADNGEDTNLWAVAQGISIQPDDYFSPQGPRWYGYSNQSGMESYAALSSAIRSINSQLNDYGEVKDMPIVKVYRTVPTNIVGEQLESEGQWVTPSLEYAIRHGENRFDGNYRIIEQEVPADQLWWDGMDPREWGFDDGTNNVYQNTKNNRKLFEVTYDQDGNLIPLSQRFDTENEDIRYRVGTEVVEMGDNTLVGLHNISTAKLRKAIKQGGLANPSVAVINMAIQDHEQYGDITLVMPSSMIDSTTGRNAGTYTGDIWSPTYPYVERKMSSKGSDKYYDALNKAFEGKNRDVKSRTAVIFVNMLDNQGNPDNLAYWYMLEKGIDPTDVIINSGISDDIKQRFEPLIDKRFASNLTTEERELLLGIAAELEGKTTEELLQAAQEAKKRYEDTVLANEKASQFSKNIALSAIDEIDTYGVRLNVLSDTMRRVREAIDKDGGVDVNATISAAVDYVQANGLKDDFDAWLDNLDDRFDIEEVIFDGYTRDGDRKYVKNTIANASRLMNQQPIQNATSHGGLSATRGQLVERMSTLAQIRANKHRLAAINEYEDEQWKAMQDEWFNEIINPLSEMQKIDDNTFINMDIAEQRLLEAIMEKDPIAYLNREYGYSIAKDSEFTKSLKDLMQRLKELPSKYFETKFKRPVMLNEFVSAVVPQDLPQDLKDSLKEAGLDVYEYNDTEGSRREATIEATNGEGVRFRIGYEPMNDRSVTPDAAQEMAEIKANAERNGTYLKAPNGADTNLTPRQWLQVRTQAFKEWFGDWESKFRIAKLRDSKPIIATGNEYEGKYELNRDSAEKYILKSLRGAYVNKDTGSVINISRRGAEKVVRHDNDNDMHFKSIALIPQMIENAIYMGELPNEKGINGFDTYRYYVVGLNINGEDYTAKLVIGYIGRENYYDHALTQIEKGKLLNDIDLVKARFDTKEFDFERKDTKLFQILQINLEKSENFSQIVDENGEPMPLKHRTFAEFTEFDKEKIGSSTDPGAFGTGFYFGKKDWILYGNKTMEVFIDMKNPLRLNYGNAYEIKSQFFKEDVTNQEAAKAMTEWAIAQGYDGVIWEDGLQSEFVAYDPNQIKSATDNVGTFDDSSDDIRFRIANDNQRIFISNAERAVEQIKQDKATPRQWKAMIEKQGGLKAGEDKWLGLSEWLDSQDKKTITKQEVLDFIAENQIQIEEVAYSAKPKNEVFEQYKQEYRDYYFEAQDNGAEDPQDVAWNRMLEEHGEDFGLGFWAFGSELQVEEDSDYTNWEYENETNERPINETRLDYTTEGLENKREIALTVPTIESWNVNDEVHFGDAGGGRAIAWVRFGETSIPNESNPKTKEYLDAEEERKNFSRKMMAKYGLTYTEGDMSRDELQQDLEITKRISQLKDAQEKIKVLVIDEIQSKRHQEGREKGYYVAASSKELLQRKDKAEKDYIDFLESMRDKYGDLRKPELYTHFSDEEVAEADRLNEAANQARSDWFASEKDAVPAAPFEKNWHELAFKRILRYAAENGFDKVAWTTGAQQAERYDIGSEINVIDVNRDEIDDDIMDVYIYTTKQYRVRLDVSRTTGKVVYVADMYKEFMDKPLSELIGKDLANDIIKSEYEHHRYEGDGLRIGGEGMKGFYDKMLPSFVSKYVKKWGAKVGEVTMPQLEEGYQTMHSVDITPEMRESVMEGQTMFRISSDKNDVQNVATEIWNKYQYDGELESMRDVAEYAEEHMPRNAQTQALFDAIDAYRIEAEEDRMYYGMRGDLEPFEDAIMDEVERLMNATTQSKLTESEQLTFDALQEVAADAGLDVTVGVSQEEALKAITQSDEDVEPSIRTKPAPKKTGIGYKVFYRGKDGKLYPPMVANPNGADTPIGVWLDADAAPMAGESKTGRPQVKAGGKGTQGGSGTLAYRPGWHLGEIPYALQFNRKDETGERTLFPKDFVWAEVEYADDVNYQEEAESYGYTENGKYRHSYAGLPRVPENGSYRYRTNPNPLTDPWIITGAMKVNRVLTKEEVDEIVRKAGREPQPVELLVNPINGTILGYAQGNRIVLTREGMNPETMVHEYTHIWAKAMQRNNRAGWENIKEIFKQSPLWEYVKNDPNYKDRLTTDDAICSELLARFSSKQGAERLDEVARDFIYEEQQKGGSLGAARVRQFINHARQAIKSFWKWVGKNLFGITKFDSMEDVADRVLYDLLNATKLDVDTNDKTVEADIERPSAEFVEAMRAWNDANPYPIYTEGESLGAFSDRLTAWKEVRDAYRAELWRKSQEKIEDADPISEPMVAGSKPVRKKDETPLEYAQRLKQWQNAQIDSQLSEEYTAEMNRLAGRLERAKRAFVDAALPIEEWQNWLIERGATMTSESNAYQDIFLAQGRVSNAAEELRRDVIQKLTRKIAAIIESKKLDDVDLRWHNMDVPGTKRTINGNKLSVRELIGVYCQAKDCEEAEEKGLPDRGKAGFKNNLDVEYTDVVNAVETRLSREDITELWSLINQATKYALDYDLASGRISQDTYDEFADREYYVPQRGWRERDESGLIEEYEPVGKRGHDPYNAALVKARGRQSLAADPFAYIMSIDHSSIVSSENNKIKQKMLQFCLDNEEIGLKTGAFRVKKYWLMHEIDPNTGKIRKDEDGTPITLMSYTEPKADDFKHDKKVKDEVKRIEKEMAKRKKALEKELEEHGDTNYAKALQRAIANSEAKIEDLNDTLIIAFGATNTHISQRTRDEKLQHEVQVMKDGQRYVIELQDEKVANAINKKFKQHQEALFNVSDKMRNATRFMSAMLTQYNPEFAASNFVRDFQVAVMTLASENPKLLPAFLKNFAACQRAVMAYAFADKVQDRTKYVDSDMGRLLEEYMKSGAPTGFSYMQDLKTLRKDFDSMVNEGKLSRGVRSAAGIFSMVTEISETAVRFSAYAAARKAGWAINDAAYMSKELTTNFDRAGEMADSGWMSWFSFMRATINGNVKFFRAFKKFPIAYSITAAVYFAMGLINQFANPNDPEDEVWASDYTRETNFIIGKWRIPAAHFMRIFYSAGVNMASWMQGERTFGHAAYNSSMSAFNEILPNYMNIPGAFIEWSDEMERVKAKDPKAVIRELAPTPISPFVDVWANRNFMGGTINREPFVKTQENTKDILMAKDNTLPIYRAITEGIYTAVGGDLNSKYKSDDNAWTALFDVSGSSLEHITEGYLTGGMDMLATTANMIYDAVQGNELTPDKITFIRKFYNQYTPQRAYDQQYWLLKGRVQEYQRKLNDYEENNPDKYELETRSKQYKAYEETNELIWEKIENPTAEDVKQLMEANKQWIKASK